MYSHSSHYISHRSHYYVHNTSFINPCVKYSLFFFNFILWLIGTLLICLGCWSFSEEYHKTDLSKFRSILDVFAHISLVLIVVGSVIFMMSFTGCIGALRENLWFLKLYSFFLLLLFIGEIILSTVAFVFPNTISYFLKEKLSKDPIIKYRDDMNLQNLIDSIQTEFQCCGISDKGYKDWSRNIYFNCSEDNPSPEKCAVPFTCCRNSKSLYKNLINAKCGHGVQSLKSVVEVNKFIYTRGCIEAITELFEKNMYIVTCVCLVSAIVHLLIMFLAGSLQGQILMQQSR